MTHSGVIVLHLLPLPAGPDDPPAAVRLRTILKRLLRDHKFKCLHATLLDGPGIAQDMAEVLEAIEEPADVAELQALVRCLARRVAEQAELLARRAEKRKGAKP